MRDELFIILEVVRSLGPVRATELKIWVEMERIVGAQVEGGVLCSILLEMCSQGFLAAHIRPLCDINGTHIQDKKQTYYMITDQGQAIFECREEEIEAELQGLG